jgi:alkylation response protein AidB-like acyl-CoA dehydrogenase
MGTNIEEKKSMDLAEDSRQKQWKHPSFSAELFMGKFKWNYIHPYISQSEEDKKIGDEFIDKIEQVITKYIDPEKVDEEKVIPEEALTELKKLGCYGMKIPKDYGGLGLSNTNYTRAISFISSHCASTAVLLSAHQSIGVPQPLKMYGSDAQKNKYFPMLAEGALSAFALTEPGVGSDPAQMTTTAKISEDKSHYILNGEKLWCTNGPAADVIIVMAVTEPKIIKGKERKQISAFILETNSPGFSVIHKCEFMGLKGIINGLLKFENVKIPAENLLHKEGTGLKIALETLNAGRLAIPVCSAAAGKKCMTISKDWANKRVQWGKKVGDHQAVAELIGNMSADTYAMDCMSKVAVSMADNPKVDIRLEAAIAKYYCSEVACRIADDTLQVKGGRGYENSRSLRERGERADAIERLIRDLRINRIIEGSSEIMRLFIAREAVDVHFSKAMPFLKTKSIGKKLSMFFGLAIFYTFWFPKLYIPRIRFFKAKNLNCENKCHLSYISRTSRKLARRLFIAMMKHQIKLQDEQILLGNFVDIGVKLFTMSSVLSVTDKIATKDNQELQTLANEFCSKTRREISQHFWNTSYNGFVKKTKLEVSKNTLDGKYEWLEKDNVLYKS